MWLHLSKIQKIKIHKEWKCTENYYDPDRREALITQAKQIFIPRSQYLSSLENQTFEEHGIKIGWSSCLTWIQEELDSGEWINLYLNEHPDQNKDYP
jgi:hypothetical protein